MADIKHMVCRWDCRLYNSATSIHPRIIYISTVKFVRKHGVDVLVVDPEYITPILK